MNRPSNVQPLHLRPAAAPTARDRLQAMPSASPIRFYAGLFVTTAATLALQILFTRILSLVAWYHLAFFAISMAMFGLTAGAVWVYRGGARFSTNSLAHDLPRYTLLFALSSALALVALLSLAPAGTSTLTSAVIWIEMALALATPFFFSGVVVSLALTRSPYPVGRVYGVDLLGAGFGCLGVLVLLNLTDGPSAIFWTSAAAALAAYFFLPANATEGLAKNALLAAGVLAAVAMLNGFSLRGLQPIMVKGEVAKRGPELDFEHWNTFSRVAGTRSSVHSPFMWGPSPKMDPDFTFEQRGLDIDGAAYTAMYRFNGDRASVAFLQNDLTNLVYALPGRKRAAVIGVGGGRDVLSAWANGAESVTGVEINPVFIRLLTRDLADYAGLSKLPGVHFEVDEARSWFAASPERFDTIQMSMIDTWAATGAGAFTLSENGLYTVEAWRVFLEHLTPQGAFNVSRWFAPGEVNETGRMISLAMAALLEEGAQDPARHIFLASAERIATLVLARNPLSAEDLAALTRRAEDRGFEVLLHPDRAPRSELLGRLVAARDRATLDRIGNATLLDLTPPVDDRPFFFNQLPLTKPYVLAELAASGRATGVLAGNLQAATTLLLLVILSFVLVMAAIVLPLKGAVAKSGNRLVTGGTSYFVLIGLGFMAVEIGLMQRMSVFLGHPVYALSITLFCLILSTGFGSLLSERLRLDTPTRLAIWAVATTAYLAALPLWLPSLTTGFDDQGLLVRATVAIAAIAPAGLMMGFGFPTGMRLVNAQDQRPTPWFWGLNGAAGVLASGLAVALSMTFGIGATLVAGAACYLLLIPAARMIGFPTAED